MNGSSIAFVIATAVMLGACDPPEPSVTRGERSFHQTCIRVIEERVGDRLSDVLGPAGLAAARGIVGVSPDVAFALRHDRGAARCEDEQPRDWLLAYRVDLSDARVESLERSVRSPG